MSIIFVKNMWLKPASKFVSRFKASFLPPWVRETNDIRKTRKNSSRHLYSAKHRAVRPNCTESWLGNLQNAQFNAQICHHQIEYPKIKAVGQNSFWCYLNLFMFLKLLRFMAKNVVLSLKLTRLARQIPSSELCFKLVF